MMEHRSCSKAILSVLFAFTAIVFFAAAGYAAKGDLVMIADFKQNQDPTLVITRGKAEIVDVAGAVSDIMVADPSIVDVMALQANRLYVVGSELGTTNIIAVDENGDIVKRLNVMVKFDDQAIQGMVDSLFPEESVKIHTLADQVVLTGHVSTPSTASQIATVVSQYVGEFQGGAGGAPDDVISNMLTVAGEHQVMLRVKIVEASRDVLKELGLETSVFEGSGNDGAITGESFTTATALGLTTDPLGIGTVLFNGGRDGTGGIQLTLRALEDDGLINTLAEPNLTAISGEEAGFLAGGEFPIPSSRDQDGNVIITYRDFGVSLNFVPTVMSEDLISLQLGTEVSAVSNQNSIDIDGLSLPGFTVRRAQTTVEIPSGGSLMIAGLLESEVTKSLNHLPGLANLPVIGDLISSESFQRSESELVVIVTAYLVKPYADKSKADKVPDAPEHHALAMAFTSNIRRVYKSLDIPDGVFSDDMRFGNLID